MYQQINGSRIKGSSGLNRIIKFCGNRNPNNLLNCVFSNSNSNFPINGRCFIGDVILVNYDVKLQIIDNTFNYVYNTKTDNNGNFSINVNFNINQLSELSIFYLTAFYDSIKLINIISKFSINNLIAINSITTLSSVYAFNKYLSNDCSLFTNGILNGSLYELNACLQMANNIAIYNGTYSNVITSNPNENETHIFKMLGNIENIFYGCVRESSNTILTNFLNYTDVSGVGINNMNTLLAIYNMCNYPSNNVNNIFNLSYDYIFNLNYLTVDVLPNSFIVAIKFNNSGNKNINLTFGGPGNMVFDKDDKIWFTNNVIQGTTGSSDYSIILEKNGLPFKLSPLDAGYVMGSGFGITINSTKTIITIGNFGWGGVYPTYPITNINYNGTIYPPNNYSGILEYVQGVIYDRNDNLWVCSNGNSRVALFYNNNPNLSTFYQLDSSLNPFHLAQDNLDDNIVVSCKTNLIKFSLNNNSINVVYNIPIITDGGNTDLLGLSLDNNDNVYVANSTGNAIVKVDTSGVIIKRITNSIFTPWSCYVYNNKLFVCNFGPTTIVNKYNYDYGNNGYYSVPCLNLDGDLISPENGYLIQSGGNPVLLSNGDNLFTDTQVKCFYPLMRQTSCRFDKFGYMWVTNNWKPPFIIDALNNPGGDGVFVMLGLQK